MVNRIAERIMEARDISLESGQEKYRAYFINTKLYLLYKDEVDIILQTGGYDDCIVNA